MLLLNRLKVNCISGNNCNTFRTKFSSYLFACVPAQIVRSASLGTSIAIVCTEVASVHTHCQLATRLDLDWTPRLETQIPQSSWLLLLLSYCQNSADNRAAEAKNQFQGMQTKLSSHITQAVPAAPPSLHPSFLNTQHSAVHTSGVITPQVKTFLLL